MNFDPAIALWKFESSSEVHWESNSQSEKSLGSVGVHSFTLSYTLGSMKCDSCASLLACTFVNSFVLVVSPRLGLRQFFCELVVTCIIYTITFCKHSCRGFHQGLIKCSKGALGCWCLNALGNMTFVLNNYDFKYKLSAHIWLNIVYLC
jgi:hypothetical protein